MRYLFFDIECANCFGTAKICSFGYVLTDLSFRVLAKRDLIINPRAQFYKPPDKHIPGKVIEPAYARELYLEAPEFPAFYDTIRDLLCNPEHIVIGHAPQNDAKFLLQTCARYRLPSFDYNFYDAQALYASLAPADSKLALDAVCEALGISVLQTHCSMSDAFMTMECTRAIAKRQKATPEALFAARPQTAWRVVSGYLIHQSAEGAIPESKDADERIRLFLHAAELARSGSCRREKPLRWVGSNRANPSRQKELSTCLARIEKLRTPYGAFAGKRIAISIGYTKMNLVQTAFLAARVAAAGGVYDQSTSQIDVFVYPPEDIPFSPCFRYRAAKGREQKGKSVLFLSFAEFLSRLQVPSDWLSHTEYPEELAEKLAKTNIR